jgi:hypothetical protein
MLKPIYVGVGEAKEIKRFRSNKMPRKTELAIATQAAKSHHQRGVAF